MFRCFSFPAVSARIDWSSGIKENGFDDCGRSEGLIIIITVLVSHVNRLEVDHIHLNSLYVWAHVNGPNSH